MALGTKTTKAAKPTIASLTAEVEKLKGELTLARAAAEATGSVMLEVQQESIAATQRAQKAEEALAAAKTAPPRCCAFGLWGVADMDHAKGCVYYGILMRAEQAENENRVAQNDVMALRTEIEATRMEMGMLRAASNQRVVELEGLLRSAEASRDAHMQLAADAARWRDQFARERDVAADAARQTDEWKQHALRDDAEIARLNAEIERLRGKTTAIELEWRTKLEQALSTLRWVSGNYYATLGGKSVRDADECLEAARLLIGVSP